MVLSHHQYQPHSNSNIFAPEILKYRQYDTKQYDIKQYDIKERI